MFDNIIGQEQVTRFFSNILKQQRLAHLYLFVGPAGVGKFLFAKELSRLLLCDRGISCGECKSCQQVNHLSHPDLRIIEPSQDKRDIPIELVRDLKQEMGLKPFYGSYKVFIINEADLLSEPAANALLKTLEEPPSYSLIILVTARPEAIRPTVYSRAQVIRFRPIRRELLIPLIEKQFKLRRPEAEILAALSAGSPGGVKYLIENNFLPQRELILKKLISCLKTEGKQARWELASSLGNDIIRFGREASAATTETRAKIIQEFRIIALFLRDLVLDSLRLSPEKINSLEMTRLVKSLETLLAGERAIRANANINLVVADTLLNLCIQ